MPQELKIVAVYAALNALVILALSYNVGRHRARTGSLTPGATGDDILVRAIRAHANAAEYIPLAVLMLLVLALLSAPPALLHVLGAALILGRIAQAWGMVQARHPNAIRFTGNLLTGLVYLVSSSACLYYGLT